MQINLESIWNSIGFKPTEKQKKAIYHASGPLFLPAGPGSGKTRVLLWRVVNLIVNEGINPERIFLSTFTEKAAKQLREGLQSNLAIVSANTNINYDISQLYVGTVHSLCRKIILDKRLNRSGLAKTNIEVLAQLEQFLFLKEFGNWNSLATASGKGANFAKFVIGFTSGRNSSSKTMAALKLAELFNKISEEDFDHKLALKNCTGEDDKAILNAYDKYLEILAKSGPVPKADLSILQLKAYLHVSNTPELIKAFDHIIVDEYQDTNSIQEKLFFLLAKESKNLCVVGDDDQALYRFRGATVENFLGFEKKCNENFGVAPTKIPLDTNYRSKKEIVEKSVELLNTISWQDEKNEKIHFRISDKEIEAGRADNGPAVFKTEPNSVQNCAKVIALRCREMLDKGIVESPNQIAFLFNSVQSSKPVDEMRIALEDEGFTIYSPRSESFLQISEVQLMLGLIIDTFGLSIESEEIYRRGEWGEYLDWITTVRSEAQDYLRTNKTAFNYFEQKKKEIKSAISASDAVDTWFQNYGLGDKDPISVEIFEAMQDSLVLDEPFSGRLKGRSVSNLIERGSKSGQRQITVRGLTTILTSLDWGLLDLFWQIMGLEPFKKYVDDVSNGIERQAMNLSRLSNLLDKYVDHQGSILRANDIKNDKFSQRFLASYLYSLWVTKESGVEDEEAGFPRECIPFLTIHQSKGLEFPVVVIGNPKKKPTALDPDDFVRRLSNRKYFEPVDRIPEFDLIRLYYVAFTRAKNILIVPHFEESRNHCCEHIQQLFRETSFNSLENIDFEKLTKYSEEHKEVIKNYSFTSDYQFYEQCARQYMLFRYLDFTPARTQSLFFGSLVHKTIEDLHHRLILIREKKVG